MKALLLLIVLIIRAILVYGVGVIIALLLPLYVAIEYFKPMLDITYGNDVVGTPSTNFIVFFGAAYIPSLIIALWATYMSRDALEYKPMAA